MPPLTRLYIKTSLVYLLAALGVALVPALQSWGLLPTWTAALTPVYFHLFLVGWITQLIIGVAHWMFPKYSREQPRGAEPLLWATYGCLNAGLLLRVVAEPAWGMAAQPGGLWGWLLVLAATLQWIGGLTFVINTWPRVKEK